MLQKLKGVAAKKAVSLPAALLLLINKFSVA